MFQRVTLKHNLGVIRVPSVASVFGFYAPSTMRSIGLLLSCFARATAASASDSTRAGSNTVWTFSAPTALALSVTPARPYMQRRSCTRGD